MTFDAAVRPEHESKYEPYLNNNKVGENEQVQGGGAATGVVTQWLAHVGRMARDVVNERRGVCVEAVERGIIQMDYIRSESQTADVLAKCLTGIATLPHRGSMVNEGVLSPTKGRCKAAMDAAWAARRAHSMSTAHDVVDECGGVASPDGRVP